MKRSFDILLSIFLMVLLALPLILISLSILLTSKGPYLYWSKRIGQGNKTFRMPKFRTMTQEAPEVASHLLENPASFYTPLGQFLRKYSIDELPQLYSVFVGHVFCWT